MRINYLPALLALRQLDRLPRMIAGLTACILFFFVAAKTFADSNDSSDPFEDLRARISQLEKDNLELRTALSKTPDEPIVPMISDLPPQPIEIEEDANKSPEDRKMESLVDGMIRRMNSQYKAQSDAQDAQIAALEKKLDAATKKAPRGVTASFGDAGLVFISNDGNFATHFGGTAQLDFIAPESTAAGIAGFGPPTGQNLTQDSTNFRRLRMRADGTMYQFIDWVSEFDFANYVQDTANPNVALAANGLRNAGPTVGGVASTNQQGGNTLNVIQPTTVWMTFRDVPLVQNIRIGNQQDWFSIEHVINDRYLDFMERAQIMDAFTGPNNNGFAPGLSFFGNTPNQNAGLQLGIYKNNQYDSSYTFSLGNAFTYGGRAIWTPYYDECSGGRYLVHTGFGMQYRSFDTTTAPQQQGENVRVRSRGDLRIVSATLTPNFTDTGNFFAEGQTVIDPEIAVVWGPWTLQAEYTASWFNGARSTNLAGGQALPGLFMSGGYAEALYFLTGENKIYNRQTGSFGQVIPIRNWNPSCGEYGAWQLGARIDWLDMNSGLVTGGRDAATTLGLNWWLNPNVRFQFNIVGTYIQNNTTTSLASAAGTPAGTVLANGLSAGSNNAGALNGSKFTGEGLIMTIGTRMDISF